MIFLKAGRVLWHIAGHHYRACCKPAGWRPSTTMRPATFA